jgi:recombination protein RecA
MGLALEIPEFHKLIGIPDLPDGYVYEIYGEETSGKTSVALQFIAAAQHNPNAVCVFLDGEHSLSLAHLATHHIDVSRVHLIQPVTLDHAMVVMNAAVRTHIARLVVIDGLNALPTVLELTESLGSYSRRSETAAARLITKSFQGIIGPIWDQQTTIVVLNQVRHKPNFDGTASEFVPGGRLLPILSPLRIRVGSALVRYSNDGAAMDFSTELSVTRNRFRPTQLGFMRTVFPFVAAQN